MIVETKHAPREFISSIFVREKSDGSFHLILNMKRLNEVIEHKKFKTTTTMLHLVRPGIYREKWDIRYAYYSVPMCEDHQRLLKFHYQTSLFKFTALPDGCTELPRKFKKLMKPPLAFLKKKRKNYSCWQ